MTLMQAEGMVIKNYSGFYYVQDKQDDIYECKVRGKLKEKLLSGDRVVFTPLENQKGILEKVLKRDNQLYRPRVANVTRVLIVMAYDQPQPDLMLLDRLLFLALYNRITPCIVLNKCDLAADESANRILSYYPAYFEVFQTSARQNLGLENLSSAITGEVAVLAGPSGTGKSSLLKLLTGRTEVRTGEVSAKIGRGRHTTRHVELFSLPQGGWVVDTPGFSVLDLPEIRREETVQYFPDFSGYADACKFGDCLHYRETECGVKTAVEEKKLLDSRYQNYLNMLEEIIAKERCY
ncbi:MAG: ribosome small subunit-dependent GTPase A [Syntrophomonadaceae bacterium]|nr:ribosome small subunit-dependent GTPase A [Syntrophomonadaceae bacterium]